ncbi:MAG TPA: hypothetical protein VK419_09310 [Bryobacteraceae bacterium]|nr:hypothetical protein [Bryobacteraceae bacterium]
MARPSNQPTPPDLEAAIRARTLGRALEINRGLIATLRVVEGDLGSGNHLAALGGIDGIERKIGEMRSLLLLLR